MFSLNHVFHNVLNDNLCESSVHFNIPVYIVHGKYDYQVSYVLAHEYFDKIEAPAKTFFSFENSAHSPNLEEPEKFLQIMHHITLMNPRIIRNLSPMN